ncbi:MAG: twin-arginine translocation signal domain-containing protein [Terriglobia bacterium]|jgi:hypothetical protein
MNRRRFLKDVTKAGIAGGVTGSLWGGASLANNQTATTPAQSSPPKPSGTTEFQTLALETYMQRSFNYCNRMVDASGQPYFNIFWTEPAEAAHDWPDFGDVTSRQYQGVVMGRRMTGVTTPIEAVWRGNILGHLDPESGLLTRPETSYSHRVADPGDQALTLYALVTAYGDAPDPEVGKIILRMTSNMLAHASSGTGGGFLDGFQIKSLMTVARVLHDESALKLAGMQVHRVFGDNPLFTPDNKFKQGGHMHGNLRTLVGSADYALYVGDPVLFSRADALYRYVRSQGTRFGFLPESIGRQGDIVGTETCALMDYLGLAATLANHGHPEYWGDVERVVRNQLIENQARHLTWLKDGSSRPDTAQFSWRDLAGRLEGGWAGWSSPTHFLAACETLGHHWGGPELHDKTRAFQNCCGGSGMHALFIAWKNAARFESGTLSVNLHIDKLLPQAEMRGYQPFKGLLTIQLRQACTVRVRVPDFMAPEDLTVEVNGAKVAAKVFGNYLELGPHAPGHSLRIAYPLRLATEEVEIGNPGFRHYRYRVTWKGDTVVRMEPLGPQYTMGYSEYDKRQVRVFYGKDGPGLLYQRQDFVRDREPELSLLHTDDGALDFWARLEEPVK